MKNKAVLELQLKSLTRTMLDPVQSSYSPFFRWRKLPFSDCLLREKFKGMIALFNWIWVGYLVSSYTEWHWSDPDNMEKEVKVKP